MKNELLEKVFIMAEMILEEIHEIHEELESVNRRVDDLETSLSDNIEECCDVTLDMLSEIRENTNILSEDAHYLLEEIMEQKATEDNYENDLIECSGECDDCELKEECLTDWLYGTNTDSAKSFSIWVESRLNNDDE